MSVITSIERIKNKKRAKQLHLFLMELDLICDKLYDKVEYEGVLPLILKVEDLRVRYYLEWYDCDQAVKGITDEQS